MDSINIAPMLRDQLLHGGWIFKLFTINSYGNRLVLRSYWTITFCYSRVFSKV